jgi:GNAT superfamily N-acetyltransferase
MKDNLVTISAYAKSDRSDMLPLLLELHSTYYHQNAPRELQELEQEVDIKRSYKMYLDTIERSEDATWQIFLARTDSNKVVGLIIGSTEIDESLVFGRIGKLEDWYVEPLYRGHGIGQELYNYLENWFREKGCGQIQSDTWEGNRQSIKAHQQAGFFVSGISFRKKI